jgi:hypothetical protein
MDVTGLRVQGFATFGSTAVLMLDELADDSGRVCLCGLMGDPQPMSAYEDV